ncbi:hypothetical protein ACQPZ2_24580 [Nocardia pseudovaccinii]|uniref:hypothetical protein n=1 Tax=Nocardia pseudovaccinii TaxID=189540 RepID=UPI003D9365E9
MARRAANRADELRQELADRLRPHGISADELLRVGSPTWESWFSKYRRIRADLVEMLSIECGHVADDDWIHHVLFHQQQRGHATPELTSAGETFTEVAATVRLADEIRRLARWAEAVEAVEAELARLAGFDDRIEVAHRLQAQADSLYALGIAVEDYERVLGSLGPSYRHIFWAAQQYGRPTWDAPAGAALLVARLRRLLATAGGADDVVAVEEVRGLLHRATTVADLYESGFRLNADLDAAIEHSMSVLSGVSAATPEPSPRLSTPTRSSESLTRVREVLSAARDDVARRRRAESVALLDGLGREFELDLPALDELGAGWEELMRLTSLQSTRSQRLETTIGLVHGIARARDQLARIVTGWSARVVRPISRSRTDPGL